MIKTIVCLVLCLVATYSFSQTAPVYYGAAGEGYSSPSTGEDIDISYHKFTAPAADEICNQFADPVNLSSPQPAIILFPGEIFSLTELKVDAAGSSGEYIQNFPIVVGIPEIENGFLDYQPYELSLRAVNPGSIDIEIMDYCHPDAREYLTLSVINSNNISTNGLALTVPEEWVIRSEPQLNNIDSIYLFNDDSGSELRLKQMAMPGAITIDKLRAVTNVSESIELAHEDWGDYSGVHHEYIENNQFYMHWWLALENNLLLASYSSQPINEIEKAIIKKIISSLKRGSN